jgi:hypothetical protein
MHALYHRLFQVLQKRIKEKCSPPLVKKRFKMQAYLCYVPQTQQKIVCLHTIFKLHDINEGISII